jgi:PAS domain S-box-containing protein
MASTSDAPTPLLQEVLVVDDDRDLGENVAELLAAPGRHVRTAQAPDEALALARSTPFDVAVVDVRLPRTSGVELATQLHAVCPESEVILMTADASLDTAIAAVKEGAYAYVQKPFDPEELMTLATRALAQVMLRRDSVRLQRDLARSEALYRAVVDGVGDFIVGLDAAGTVHMWNEPAAVATGVRASDAVGRPFARLFASEVASDRFAQVLAAAVEGKVVSDVELPLRGRENERIVRWTFSPLEPGSELGPLVLAVGVDTTEQRELERRAVEAEALASLGKLTAGLAHEIRNPLNAASLQLELIGRRAARVEDDELRDGIARHLGIVREELARLTNLLDDFLDLARPRAITFEPVDLSALLGEVATLEEPAARKVGIAIEARVRDGNVLAHANPALMKQVLVNLVLNAIEAMQGRGHGRIVMGAGAHGSARVEVTVEDDGPGVPPEIADRIFEPFATTKEAGTGLGLTIVKRVIDRHGGSVRVGPRPGGGTVVRILLDRG